MKIHLLIGVSTLLLAACAKEPAPLPKVATLEAAATSTVVSPVPYVDPLAGYINRAPTGPRDWRSVNQEQSEGN